jgi:hypothetical protein
MAAGLCRWVGFSALLACSESAGGPVTLDDAAMKTSEVDDAGPTQSSAEDGMVSTREVVDAGSSDAFVPMLIDAGPGDADTAPRTASRTLIIPDKWLQLVPEQDPFDDRPALVSCPHTAVAPEALGGEGSLSVDTGSCNYLTVAQPTLDDVAVGETLKVRLWHFELSASEPAEAHAAVLLDGLYILNERVPIPAAGGLIVRQIQVTRAIAAGTPVYFHLHNHGTNYWALVEVSAGG